MNFYNANRYSGSPEAIFFVIKKNNYQLNSAKVYKTGKLWTARDVIAFAIWKGATFFVIFHTQSYTLYVKMKIVTSTGIETRRTETDGEKNWGKKKPMIKKKTEAYDITREKC